MAILEDVKLGLSVLNESGLRNVPELTKELIYLWFNYFKDIDGKIFVRSCVRHIAQSPFFPAIAEVMTICFETEEHPPADSIWDIYIRTTKKERDPLITEAFKTSGIDCSYLRSVTADTEIRFLRPRVEATYKRLLERQRYNMINKICDKALLTYKDKKRLK